MLLTSASEAQQAEHWVGTWAASPVGQENGDHLFAHDTTLREIVHVSLGGTSVRVVLSNEFGTDFLLVSKAQIATAPGADAVGEDAQTLTFSGSASVRIPAGALVLSDPVPFALQPLSNVAVSFFLPAQTIKTLSLHPFANGDNYIAEGDVVEHRSVAPFKVSASWLVLKGIEVQAKATAGAVLCLGDSITDGAKSTRGDNARWPDRLAARLGGRLAVLNEGINANRVLSVGAGPAALTRFDRDVLAQDGVKYLIVLEGINDIGNGYNPAVAADRPPTAEELIAGYRQLTERAHSHGIRVFGGTLVPYEKAVYASDQGEQVREAVNRWLRSNKEMDGVIDFDLALRDPAHPNVLLHEFDSGDHLHPNDKGYQAMADAIDLKLLAITASRDH